MNKILIVLIFTNICMIVYSASILDYITDSLGLEGREEPDDADDKPVCTCKSTKCKCCVDFNFPLIDLGGPGCTDLAYISNDESISVNISYGKRLLHNQIIKGPDPERICLNLLRNVAQICVRFTELLPTDDGLRGCCQIEPMLLEEPQVEIPVGCFRMGPNGMHVIESSREVIKEQLPDNESNKDEDDDDSTLSALNSTSLLDYFNTDILDVAEQGITYLSKWFGIGTSDKNTSKTNVTRTEEDEDEDDDGDDT